MSGRSRRENASRTNKVSGVLAALKDARQAGPGKRAHTYHVKQEDDVFDQVDEEQYEQLVAKRRMEAGEHRCPRPDCPSWAGCSIPLRPDCGWDKLFVCLAKCEGCVRGRGAPSEWVSSGPL